ncbi:MAG: hypothetical protein QGG67_00175 [Gammaproteobacteria bacterium]|nr:hypothetical protein [Gammaproteobacteria bacterium]MDP6094405.1 hypothetical protein [Gammaproteobacteria bacterium]
MKNRRRYELGLITAGVLLFGITNATSEIMENLRQDQTSDWAAAWAAEHVLRIFDIHNGEELWRYDLPTAAVATPMSYEIDGTQYIAIAVGGHDQLELQRGDYLMTFSLSE